MASKKNEVTYISRYLRLRVVVKSAYHKLVGDKRQLVVGHSIQFDQGAYLTSDQDEIDFLDQYIEDNGDSVVTKVNKDVVNERAEYVKTLEERNVELEAELAKKDTGAKKVDRKTDNSKGNGLEELTVPALKKIAKKLKVSQSGNRATLIAKIEEANDQAVKDGDKPAF